MAKIAIKRADGPLEIVETKEKYRTDVAIPYIEEKRMNTVVFQALRGDSCFSLGVNEDGLLMQLPFNFFIEIKGAFYPIQAIVGTAVFTRHKQANPYDDDFWDFELEDLTDEDIQYIKDEYINPEKQIFYGVLYDKLRRK